MSTSDRQNSGFTLIELSIVLVIIGLIVGGILTGRNLIASAAIHSQISQIEKYQQSVNAFRGKYGYLPGDIPNPDAINYGFMARTSTAGGGDGNAVLQGYIGQDSLRTCSGEQGVFWVDLSTAGMIDSKFTMADFSGFPAMTDTQSALYLPVGKIAQNYVSVTTGTGLNFFSLAPMINMASQNVPFLGLSVIQAYTIDNKIDDGMPGTGRVIAGTSLASNGFWTMSGTQSANATTAVSMSVNSCFDNNNTAGVVRQYSLTQDYGAAIRCALSFRFQ